MVKVVIYRHSMSLGYLETDCNLKDVEERISVDFA